MGAVVPLSEARSINEHLYLGEHEGLSIPPQRLVYRGPKHLLCFGPSRSGKSASICTPNLMKKRRSIFCFDPKGELTAITARRRAQLGKVLILDPFAVMPEMVPELKEFWEKHRFHWNPLAHLNTTSDDSISDARSLAEGLVDREAGGNSKFFEDSMENILTARAQWEAMTCGKAASWRNIRLELASPASLITTFDKMRKSNIYALQVAGIAGYERLTDKTSQTTSLKDVLSTVLKNTAFLDDDRIGEDMFEGEAIPFAKMHDEIITVFVVLPLAQLTKQAKWLRMLVNLAVNVFLRSAPRVAKLPPVLMMLDEFGNVGRLAELLNVLNVSAALRLQIAFFLQNVQQLKVSYPKEWTYFFAGSGAWTTFRAWDGETAQAFSDLIGKTETEITSRSRSGGNMLFGFNDPRRVTFSENTSLHVHKLVEPEDMLRLENGHTINFIEGEGMPIRGYTPGYWTLERELGPFDRNPYFHG